MTAHCNAHGLIVVGWHDRLVCPDCGSALHCATHRRTDARQVERRKARTGGTR